MKEGRKDSEREGSRHSETHTTHTSHKHKQTCVVAKHTNPTANIYPSKHSSSPPFPIVPCNAKALIVNDTGKNPTKFNI
jgi:hypothetical protein